MITPRDLVSEHGATSKYKPGTRTMNANFYFLLGASAASNSGSMVEASGYKFSEKDVKPGKIKVRKQSKAKKKADGTLVLCIGDG